MIIRASHVTTTRIDELESCRKVDFVRKLKLKKIPRSQLYDVIERFVMHN